MSLTRWFAVVASLVLAAPAAGAEPSQRPPDVAPFVACPAYRAAPLTPSGPPAPVDSSEVLEIGGRAMATMGLAIAAGSPMPPRVTATSWLVADLGSGAVLGGCAPHAYRAPASVQKLLLAATMMPRLEPTQVVEVIPADLDFEPGSSAVGLVSGGRYPIATLWLGLLLRSGNDTANVLARLGGGADGLAGGIAAMNAEARRLGARQTHAVTASGLDGPGQYTSAYDLALIARACFARDDFRRYIATRVAYIPPQPGYPGFAISNDNGLLGRYPGMLGGKTGFTDLAGQTYVGVAERDGRRLVVTLLGAQTQPLGSLTEAAALLDWGFSLPRDTAVGHLVPPEEASPSPVPAGVAATTAAPQRGGAEGASSGSPFSGTGLAVGAAAAAAILLVALTRGGTRRPIHAPPWSRAPRWSRAARWPGSADKNAAAGNTPESGLRSPEGGGASPEGGGASPEGGGASPEGGGTSHEGGRQGGAEGPTGL